MKRMLAVLSCFAVTLAFMSPVVAGDNTPAWVWPRDLSIATADIATKNYILTAGWGSVMQQMTGVRVRVLPENVQPLQVRWVKEGRVDMCFTNEALYADATMARAGYSEAGPFQSRYIWQFTTTNYGFMVRGDSPIKTLYDIKPNMKVGQPIFSPAMMLGTEASLAWANLSKEDVQLRPFGNYGAYVRSVVEGRTDVVFCSPISGVTFEVEGSPRGIRWLDYPPEDKEELARFMDISGSYVLIMSDIGVPSSHKVRMPTVPSFYMARDDMETEYVYHLVKWFDESFEAYKDVNPGLSSMKLEANRATLDFTSAPAHDGLVKYLEEKGMWTKEDEAWRQQNVQLIDKYIKAHEAATADAKEKGIKVDATSEDWIQLWETHKKDLPRFRVRTRAN